MNIEQVDVVLADDEFVNLTVAAMGLGSAGFDDDCILQVESGEDAIAQVKALQSEGSGAILVILDLHMPGGIDGHEAAALLGAEKFVRKPFLVCCSSEIVEDLKTRPWASSFHHFAPKPLVSYVVTEMVHAFEAFYTANP
jgi:CheY-like chemotaxis protein